MKRRYSKPLLDVAPEAARIKREDAPILARERQLHDILATQQQRRECVLCGESLAGLRFPHRGLEMVECGNCGQMQTAAQPPLNYPHDCGVDFDWVYPKLDAKAYADRRDRVYRPKLDWALDALASTGVARQQAVSRRWLDLGAGGGYFLDALREAGVRDFRGIESNDALTAMACERLGVERMILWDADLAAAVERYEADIYSAWFVLEHVTGGRRFWDSLATKPAGTVFLFAVPVFGLSTVFEAAFHHFSARNLDGVVHTQIYTEKSISWCLQRSGYEACAEWIFGQDMDDFSRLLFIRLEEIWPEDLVARQRPSIASALDDLQVAIDRSGLADARHILAVKT